jgi:hypothetical protein
LSAIPISSQVPRAHKSPIPSMLNKIAPPHSHLSQLAEHIYCVNGILKDDRPQHLPKSRPNEAEGDQNSVHFAHTLANMSFEHLFQNIPLSIPSFYQTSSSNVSSNAQSSSHLPFFPNYIGDFGPSDIPNMWNNSINGLSTEQGVTTSSPTSITSSKYPLMVAPNILSTAIKTQGTRFACSICGKTFTSRPRADTCSFNHLGIKPFGCNGVCGLIYW